MIAGARFRTGVQRYLGVLLLGLGCGIHQGAAAEWRWPLAFTPASDPGLTALHEEIHALRLQGVRGIRVRDRHWRDRQIDLHLVDGLLFEEPRLRGYPAGAFFIGQARISFAPQGRKARDNVTHWFGPEGVDGHEVTHALFFTLRGAPLAQQLGAEGEPTEPLLSAAPYEEVKRALRQTGTDLLQAFLNRDGRSREAAWIVLADSRIRVRRAEDALLLYVSDPASELDHLLMAAGHGEITWQMPHKYFFTSLAWARPLGGIRPPPVRASRYLTRLSTGAAHNSTRQETTIALEPTEDLGALRFDLTPRLTVASVEMDNRPLGFTQWEYREGEINPDPRVLVSFDPPLPAARPIQLTIRSSGSLFEHFGRVSWLADEDAWYPAAEDPGLAHYELWFTVPKNQEAVSVGRLMEEELFEKERRRHFATQRLQRRPTIYFGEFAKRSAAADSTRVEVYVDRHDPSEMKNLQFTLDEIGNMIKVYNKIFSPLNTEVLRVTSTPTQHGRGFDGLLLLAHAGFRGQSVSDLFRAHEVAHQWWGNMVDTRYWPEDRWLSESFAEYSSMEYYQIRFGKPERTREQIYVQWVRPLLQSPKRTFTDLLGRKRQEWAEEVVPVIDGGKNVYTKGPLVLHMLRYLCRVQKGGDAVFWELLRDFLARYQNQQATTVDFTALAERHLGIDLDWFWDQWLYSSEIPAVRWSHTVQPKDGKWEVAVQASEEGTGFTLLVPVYAHLGGERMATRALLIEKGQGSARMLLPEKPLRVSLNDFHESLVRILD